MSNTEPQTPLQDNRVTDNRGSNATAWVVAGIVALVAIIAVAFMVTTNNNRPDDTAITQAQDLGRAEGMLAGAQATVDAARDSANAVADRTAAETAQASADARAAADRAAQSAQDAANPPPVEPQQPSM
ncbi:MAG: hypothetical protein Q8L66_03980 [Caulobacter sp.]|nr:hypothetical protein [Caulobacter sp.]